jgi:hypothetical protein
MRLALASLVAAGSFGAAAVAQDTPPPPAPVTPAPSAPAPAAPPAASPAPAGAPAADPAAAAAQAVQQPAPAATPAPAAPEAPLTFAPPTDPTSIAVINTLEKVCVPAVGGADFQATVKAAGFKKKRDGWVMPMAKPYQIMVAEPGSNKNVCNLTVDYQIDGAQTLVSDLHAWAQQRQPFLQQYRNDSRNDPDFRRTTVSWEHVGEGTASTGLVFVGLKKTDGAPLLKGADQATILYSERK